MFLASLLVDFCLQLLPCAGLTVRHSSLLAQLITTHLNSSDSHSVSSPTSISLKPSLPHTAHRPFPSQQCIPCCHQSRRYCTDLSYHTSAQSNKTLRELRSVFRSFHSLLTSSRLYSTTPSLFYCHKSPTELQKSQRIDQSDEDERDKSGNSTQHQKPTQLFQLIRTVLREEGEALQVDPEHNIQRNIRPAVAGDPEVITEKLKELLRGVHHGNRAKLAEAITLSE